MAVIDDGVIDRREVFLSHAAPTGRDWRVALVVIAVATAIFVVQAPFADIRLAAIPAFIPAYQAALLVSDLITAVVLFGQFLILRDRGLLFLASAYPFTRLTIMPHTLSFPSV